MFFQSNFLLIYINGRWNSIVWKSIDVLTVFSEFNTEELITDDLRANIAKLNANIVCSCLSQGIPVELTNVSYTLENLLKLLTLEQYRCR